MAFACVITFPCISFVPTRDFVAASRLVIVVSTVDANAAESIFSISLTLPTRDLTIASAADPLSVIAVNDVLVIAYNPEPALFEASIKA